MGQCECQDYVGGNIMERLQAIATQPRCIIVVPTNRPERIEAFLRAWAPIWMGSYRQIVLPPGSYGASGAISFPPEVYIIEDALSPTLGMSNIGNLHVKHFCHADIDRDLGDQGMCIDRFSPGVRSYGVWKAAQAKPEMIWTTDDDCMPLNGQDPVEEHRKALAGRFCESWYPVQSTDNLGVSLFHRGHPYAPEQRIGKTPVLNHGLVAGVPDIDAVTQLAHSQFSALETTKTESVARSYYFPMSIQNVAFRPEIAPLMYLPKLPDGMKRWSDIWCGLVMKHICDAHGLPVTTGAPCVLHERASNVWANLKQEWAGYEINERLWKVIDAVKLEGSGLVTDYLSVAEAIGAAFPELAVMVDGMKGWAKLWR